MTESMSTEAIGAVPPVQEDTSGLTYEQKIKALTKAYQAARRVHRVQRALEDKTLRNQYELGMAQIKDLHHPVPGYVNIHKKPDPKVEAAKKKAEENSLALLAKADEQRRALEIVEQKKKDRVARRTASNLRKAAEVVGVEPKLLHEVLTEAAEGMSAQDVRDAAQEMHDAPAVPLVPEVIL